MTEPKKVYVVTAGEYSDYHIKGIFSTREKAEAYINYSTDMDLNGVDEITMDELQPSEGRKVFCIESDLHAIDCQVYRDYGVLSCQKDLFYIYTDYGIKHIRLSVEAESRERAIKVAAERIRRIKADELTRYPLMRHNCQFYSQKDGSRRIEAPVYHYHTGEIIVSDTYVLSPSCIPEALKKTVKTIGWSELRERSDNERKEESK